MKKGHRHNLRDSKTEQVKEIDQKQQTKEETVDNYKPIQMIKPLHRKLKRKDDIRTKLAVKFQETDIAVYTGLPITILPNTSIEATNLCRITKIETK